MKRKINIYKNILLLGACLFALAIGTFWLATRSTEYFPKQDVPLLKLSDTTTEISNYHYLGSWGLIGERGTIGSGVNTAILTFNSDKGVYQLKSDVSRLKGSSRRQVTSEMVDAFLEKIKWEKSQVSLFAFRALATRKQTALLEVSTDVSIVVYVNDKPVRGISTSNDVELGMNMLIPVEISTGENDFIIRIVSRDGPPRIRMSLILDRSKDFQAAWFGNWGFLNKQIFNKDRDSFETPVVKWNPHLNRMTVSAEVSDVFSGRVLLRKEALRNGNAIRDGAKVLGEGLYKIIYNSNDENKEIFEEYFLVGSPKNMLETIMASLKELAWTGEEEINLEAQLIRSEILFSKTNYQPESKVWQEKALYTLASMVKFINLKKQKKGNIFKGLPELQFRGFVSKIDNSRQYYRLFIPSTYKSSEKLPLLLIPPMSIEVPERPFLASPLVAVHRPARQISMFAEKYGFAVLWPGYRNSPAGWPCEAAHATEALGDVEANYNIDNSRISLYGICSGGVYAGQLASIYPKRFAAIVYDRAIFKRDANAYYADPPISLREWLSAIDPAKKIIDNSNIKIFVLHDGTPIEGHGVIELTKAFLRDALPKRPDIRCFFSQRKKGAWLWDSIFELLANCRNEHPDQIKVDIPGDSGYSGPICEVFAVPFIVVEGTRTSKDEAVFMHSAIKNLKVKYQKQFYGAEFVHKRDSEVTDEDIEKYSLVLVGNAESNAVWDKLATKYAGYITRYNPPNAGPSSANRQEAFAEVFKNPANRKNYMLLIGADKLANMEMLENFNPFEAWFDCYFLTDGAEYPREYITSHRP